MASSLDPRSLIRGIIKTMRQESMAPTRTRLVKFLYLADLHHARHHEGQTATGWGWYVGPFGPIASEALRTLDEGVAQGWLRLWDSDLEDADEDQRRRTAVVYDVTGGDPSELPVGFGRLRAWIKRYGDTTNTLLRFVYGNTEPMQDATPGQTLDFSTAMRPSDMKPIPTRLAAKDRKRVQELLRSVVETVDSVAGYEDEALLYDDAFREGVPKDECLSAGTVVLTFPRDKG